MVETKIIFALVIFTFLGKIGSFPGMCLPMPCSVSIISTLMEGLNIWLPCPPLLLYCSIFAVVTYVYEWDQCLATFTQGRSAKRGAVVKRNDQIDQFNTAIVNAIDSYNFTVVATREGNGAEITKTEFLTVFKVSAETLATTYDLPGALAIMTVDYVDKHWITVTGKVGNGDTVITSEEFGSFKAVMKSVLQNLGGGGGGEGSGGIEPTPPVICYDQFCPFN